MPWHKKHGSGHSEGIVELTTVPPIEAEVIAARLRGDGIAVSVGPGSPYASIAVADGVPVFVSAADAARARALLKGAIDD